MKIAKIPVSKINPATYNPRIDLSPGDPVYNDLKKSITTFGYVAPLVWNSQTRNLVGGHQRFKILLEQGSKEIEVVVIDEPIEREKALNIALNKIKGRWDEQKLSELLKELTQIPDFDVNLTGFSMPEVSSLIDQHLNPKEENFDFLKAVQSIENPITKPGDIICLGKHRLLCGDSGELGDLKKLLMGEKAQLVYTDPPYNVGYDSSARPDGKKGKKWKEITSDDLPQEKYEEWLKSIFVNMGHFLDSGATCYVWNGHRQFYFMHHVLMELGYHVSSVITWVKESFAMGFAPYHWQTEHCLYFWKKNNGPHRWYGGSKQSNLWYASRDDARQLLHPTQKPIALPIKAIKNSSQQDDIVLDLFAGSGSTIIAAEHTGRRAYAVEMDPVYCDAIAKRYIAYVGIDNVAVELRDKYMGRVK